MLLQARLLSFTKQINAITKQMISTLVFRVKYSDIMDALYNY